VGDGPFDVLHAYWGVPAGLVTTLAGRRLGVPTVVTCDSGEFVALPDIGYGSQLRIRQRLAMQVTARLAAQLTVCSEYQSRLAAARGWTTRTIPFGVDCSAFVPAPRTEGPPWRLLHVASLNPVKDHGTLLRAFHLLLARGVDARLEVVGEDTLGGAASELATRLGISNRVCLLGFQPSDLLIPIYQRSHLFVLSSRHEAAGAVVLEAAACGVPVVVARRRIAAARALLRAHAGTQVIVSDDGLQHYAMKRDIEVCVFDERGVGNGWLLPAGPLR